MSEVKSDVLLRKSEENIIDEYIGEVTNLISDILGDYEDRYKIEYIVKDCLLSKGKMLRSKLLILLNLIIYKKIDPKVIDQCSVIEIIHLASLLHDDIIDDSYLRRGRISTQAKYGKDVAVFVGDFMISSVFSYLSENNMIEEILILSNTIKDMCNGEVGQKIVKFDENVREDDYFKNISNKTASLFKSVCKLAVKDSKFDQEIKDEIIKFGHNLGMIFQLRDDYLDIFSNKRKIGKEVFRDFKEGVYTYPIILALNDKRSRDRIISYIRLNNKRQLNSAEVLDIKNLLLKFEFDKLTLSKIENIGYENKNILNSLTHKALNISKLSNLLEKMVRIND